MRTQELATRADQQLDWLFRTRASYWGCGSSRICHNIGTTTGWVRWAAATTCITGSCSNSKRTEQGDPKWQIITVCRSSIPWLPVCNSTPKYGCSNYSLAFCKDHCTRRRLIRGGYLTVVTTTRLALDACKKMKCRYLTVNGVLLKKWDSYLNETNPLQLGEQKLKAIKKKREQYLLLWLHDSCPSCSIKCGSRS